MKTIYLKLTFFLLLCSFSLLSYSQNNEWIEVVKDDGSTYYMRSKPSSYSSVKKIWVKETNKSLEVISKVTHKTIYLPNAYSISLYEFDCDESRTKFISKIIYNSNGKVYNSFAMEDYEQEWKDVIPDSLGELLLSKACELF